MPIFRGVSFGTHTLNVWTSGQWDIRQLRRRCLQLKIPERVEDSLISNSLAYARNSFTLGKWYILLQHKHILLGQIFYHFTYGMTATTFHSLSVSWQVLEYIISVRDKNTNSFLALHILTKGHKIAFENTKLLAKLNNERQRMIWEAFEIERRSKRITQVTTHRHFHQIGSLH